MVTLSGPTSLDSGMDIHPIITFLKEGDGGRGRERKRAKERGRKEERGRGRVGGGGKGLNIHWHSLPVLYTTHTGMGSVASMPK